ncbi:tannase [Streptomyces tendae]|uniref:tannase/feruloyl esterase family alpha/beta hydrolase n=1 Tax=Streptomyces tendae TaxID=1932 RepID=UPI0016755708|nr:tannase/feruloyl esterase family alpha/beta hydrolase [Streptomyces tendae]GHB11007.1 tannase [Streptomyces tendae]
MRRLLTVLAAGVPLAAAVYLPTASADTGSPASTSAPTQCRSVPVKAPAGTRVESVTAVRQPGGTVTGTGYLKGTVYDVPSYCEVTVTLTHPGEGDHAKVRTWLPERAGWSGRFQAFGGSAWAVGDNNPGLANAVKQGYAAATTDGGVGDAIDSSWALDSNGKVNTSLLKNFAERSQHEAAVVGKAVTDAIYGKAPSYSYFNGCSTGGREGYVEAQRYPDDYDGILANSPAINWDDYVPATLWPQVVMNEEKTRPTDCEFKAFNAAALKACDTNDGARDGLIADASRCDFDPRRLIGTKIDCDGKQETITAADAKVVRKIWDGPRTTSGKKLWYGLPIGADFKGLAGDMPFTVPDDWTKKWVAKQPGLDTSKLTYSQFTKLFKQSQDEYDKIIGSDDPDLSGFRKSGGKLLTYHGQADQYIPTAGTVDYRERVERKLGGTHRVDDFYRLFLPQGTVHCGLGGQGTDLAALTKWVEQGKAPNTLSATLTNASGQQVERDLCRYPLVSQYKGHGDIADADSFRCVKPHRH